ncbi:NAD(P)/FAD-dependent oxidoreductase [Anaeroselena agilis]|uniref:FAD/NAD(P)-binding oxidoreductase n=1 Tax=Anaeroselena agilis TaxID=3063788 RepID=A0ABU3P2V9_9FIRM|nr:FAD/NAD(P)-binding oxidoreductase [Selenomonadales bacterium 4137-cl]
MDRTKHLIIGAGPAALAAAKAIRNADKSADIKLVTREESLPYSPAMLPYLISQELSEKDFFLKGRETLDSLGIQLVRGKEVVALHPEKKEVEYAGGERETYDKLLIATGAAPQVPPVENLAPDQVYTFRTYGDFERLSKNLGQNQDIAIYGAGLVAVEAAEKLCHAGHAVTIIARSSLLRKYFDPHSVAVLEKAFVKHGGKVITKSTLAAVGKKADKLELKLGNGRTLIVDRLLVATGVAANLVTGGLIPVAAGGLMVGRHMETSIPDVFAAGDVAAAPSFDDSQNAPCPILPEAVQQGKVAGANMAGEKIEYKGWIPGNYLRCFDEHLFSVGTIDATPADGYETFEKTDGDSFLKLVVKDGLLAGAEGLNQKYVHPGVFHYLIRERVPVGEYRELLLAKPRETACWLMTRHRADRAI